jgi:GNAT superfamily N-acetyltransferase
MSKQSTQTNGTQVIYVRRTIQPVTLRRFDPECDSLDELTAMLHRAFARLGAMGLNCTCVDQAVSVTRSRVASGECHVAVCDGTVIGTVTLHAPDPTSLCAVYRRPDVASMRQFGVEPQWQNRGIGKMLLAFANHWAATHGYAQLALDTPSPAAHLLAFYGCHGFRVVDSVHFDGRRYDSSILTRPTALFTRQAVRSRRLELPRRACRRAA